MWDVAPLKVVASRARSVIMGQPPCGSELRIRFDGREWSGWLRVSVPSRGVQTDYLGHGPTPELALRAILDEWRADPGRVLLNG
jgi:hypothetical protein